MTTDGELVAAARAGDKAAFGILIERHQPMVYRLARRMVGDAELAHDLAQEALLQAYLSLDSLRVHERFRSWLYGVTLNICRLFLRTAKAETRTFEALLGGVHHNPAQFGPTVDEIAEQFDLRRVVMQAVRGLSSPNRDAVLLFYYEGFTLRECAGILGISVNALKGRLHKARHQLEVRLRAEYQTMWRGEGEGPMIPVKIADVLRYEMVRDSGEKIIHCVIALVDEASRRVMLIWVGEGEGLAVAFGLGDYQFHRPLTPVFMARLVQASGATLDSVTISALKDDVYYATVTIRTAEKTQEVDCRPSDALALAAQFNTPVYVSDQVLEQAGKPLPAGKSISGKGIQDVLAYMNELQEKNKLHVERKPIEQRQQEHQSDILEKFLTN